MRLFYALISIAGIMILLFGCAQKRETIFTVETLIPQDTVIYDTVVVDTTQDAVDSSGTRDSTVSDTVVTIAPKSNSINWLIIVTTIFYDTTYKIESIVESLTIKMAIYEKLIHDTITYTNDDMDTKDTVSDTIITDIDSLFKQFIKYTDIGAFIIDNISPDTVIDTHFVSTYLYSTTSDGSTGNLGYAIIDWMISDTIFTGGLDLLSIGADSRVFTYDNSVYIIDGSSGSLIGFNTPAITNQPLYTSPIDSSGGLHDISFTSNSIAYLTRYNRNELLVVDPANGGVIKPIDLAPYTGIDTAEVPYMQCSKVYGNKLYVLCQRLKKGEGGVIEVGPLTGLVVVVSTVNDSVLDTISLARKRPVSMDICGDSLYVVSVGSSSDSDSGGIERINLTSNVNEGVIVDRIDFYDNMYAIVIVNNSKGYALIQTKFGGEPKPFEFNPSAVSDWIEVTGIGDASGGMYYDGLYLYVGDRSPMNTGVVVINPADNRKVAGPIKMGLHAPNSVTVLTVSK